MEEQKSTDDYDVGANPAGRPYEFYKFHPNYEAGRPYRLSFKFVPEFLFHFIYAAI